MKRFTLTVASLMLFLLISVGSAITILPPILKLYPQTVLTPSGPTTNDSVSFWLVLGEDNSSCYPTFTILFTTEKVGSKTIIHVSYKQSILMTLLPCRILTTPMQYGPSFAFGKLTSGDYVIVDSSKAQGALTNDTVMKFSVSQQVISHSLSGVVTENVGMLKMFKPIKGASLYLKVRTIIAIDPPILAKESAINPGIIYPMYRIVDSVKTDSVGAFRFPKKYAEGSYLLSTIATGYVSKDTGISLISDLSMGISLTKITAYCRVKGKVTQSCPPTMSILPCIPAPVESCLVSVGFPLIQPVLYKSTALPILPPIRTITYTAFTDKNGVYVVDSIPSGSVGQSIIITAAKIGYKAGTVDTSLTDTLTMNFSLDKISTGVIEKPQSIIGKVPIITYSVSNRKLSIMSDRSSNATLEVYDLYGKLLPVFTKKLEIKEGLNTVSITGKAAKGTVVLKLKNGEKETALRCILK